LSAVARRPARFTIEKMRFGAVVAAVVDLEIDAAILEIGGAHEVVDAVHLGASGRWSSRSMRAA
jgi:hypothetical protein